MDENLKRNLNAWDEMASIHIRGSKTYPIDEFLAGKAGTTPNIPDDIGNVEGKSILHLQCHIGLDSLMWARRGAKVTGIDFSLIAIKEAQKLNQKLGLDAKFIQSDINTLPGILDKTFDIVLTYYGTITWLADLKRWGEVIAHYLKSGGFAYISDTHPFAQLFEISERTGSPKVFYDYFSEKEPTRFESEGGTYANPEASTSFRVTYEWIHTLETIIGSLTDAGLLIDYFHEFPYTFYDMFHYADKSIMQQDDSGWWRIKKEENLLPLMFSLKADKKI